MVLSKYLYHTYKPVMNIKKEETMNEFHVIKKENARFYYNAVFDKNINIFNLQDQLHEELWKEADKMPVMRSKNAENNNTPIINLQSQIKEEPLDEDELNYVYFIKKEMEVEEQEVTYNNVKLVKTELDSFRNIKNEVIDEIISPESKFSPNKTETDDTKQVICFNNSTYVNENNNIEFKVEVQQPDKLQVQPKQEEAAAVVKENGLKTKRPYKIRRSARIKNNPNSSDLINFGSNRTSISKSVFDSINWFCYKKATRKLMVKLFTKHELKTHSLSGKKRSKESAKPQLNPIIVEDICDIVVKKCKTTVSEVRLVIRSKCREMGKH